MRLGEGSVWGLGCSVCVFVSSSPLGFESPAALSVAEGWVASSTIQVFMGALS